MSHYFIMMKLKFEEVLLLMFRVTYLASNVHFPVSLLNFLHTFFLTY